MPPVNLFSFMCKKACRFHGFSTKVSYIKAYESNSVKFHLGVA